MRDLTESMFGLPYDKGVSFGSGGFAGVLTRLIPFNHPRKFRHKGLPIKNPSQDAVSKSESSARTHSGNDRNCKRASIRNHGRSRH